LNKTSILQGDALEALDTPIAHSVKPIAPVGHDLALPSRRPGHGHLNYYKNFRNLMLVKAAASAGMDIEAEEKGWILKGQQTDQDPT
jgi:hypothetical protein